MSMFDAYEISGYVENLARFLRLKRSKRNRTLFESVQPLAANRRGRLPKLPANVIADLEKRVNAKATRADAPDTTLGERISLARDYVGLSDASIARQMGVSRELVRRWRNNVHQPRDLARLAEVLNVPSVWLEMGGGDKLPANSHIGVLVGEPAMFERERLYGMTLSLLGELPDDASQSEMQALIEHAVMTRPSLAEVARHAGGRWQAASGALVFVPWVHVGERGLSRRYWSDEVEAMIQEELSAKPSVYGAWHALKSRCEQKGVAYPRLISLQKRVAKQRARVQRYGVDLDDTIAASIGRQGCSEAGA